MNKYLMVSLLLSIGSVRLVAAEKPTISNATVTPVVTDKEKVVSQPVVQALEEIPTVTPAQELVVAEPVISPEIFGAEEDAQPEVVATLEKPVVTEEKQEIPKQQEAQQKQSAKPVAVATQEVIAEPVMETAPVVVEEIPVATSEPVKAVNL